MNKPTQAGWTIKPSADDVARFACDKIIQCAKQSIAERGEFKIVLAGGTTPEKVYRLLADLPCDWQHWQLYLGDERCLPADDPQRNSSMVKRTLLASPRVKIPASHCHFIPAEKGAKQAAQLYQEVVSKALPFDMVLLGMGEDGHTASLFPDIEYLRDEMVHAVYESPKPPPERVSLSAHALSQNRQLLIIVTGKNKQQAVHQWQQGEDIPVARIGSLHEASVLLDQQAAKQIEQDKEMAKKTSKKHPQLSQLPSYKKLQDHFEGVRHLHMRRLFSVDNQRFRRFSIEHHGLLLDYSKNRITPETIQLLCDLARESDIAGWRERMFQGDKINNTENRAVLHTALRNCSGKPVIVDGKDVMPEINAVLDKMQVFAKKVRKGDWKGFTGKTITDVINIGIGGSDLGPKMVYQALKPYRHKKLKVHFVSNVDGAHIEETLEQMSPETTFFIVSSKTFTTQETLSNAHVAREWVLQAAGDEAHIKKHFVAVSTNTEAVTEFGIDPDHMFEFWDWVGGRYSLWSAIGLSVVLAIGMKNFRKMLLGAHVMDTHFQEAPFEENMPVILAILGIWYNNFFKAESHGIFPYDFYLRSLPMYLEQADMESNGKSVDRYGRKVNYPTGPIIWGTSGINGQHAFYQSLHQGTRMVPADFIVSMLSHSDFQEQHNIMFSSALAQTEALMRGRNIDETYADLIASGRDPDSFSKRIHHMVFEGNHPSNTILIRKLSPRTLGMLIALYEHKIFVQGIIWNLNSFDQWGVELGKQLAIHILDDVYRPYPATSHDVSTNALINFYRETIRKD
jgi:glucose-6-phosphate isomerase